jgi:hypothetical protein
LWRDQGLRRYLFRIAGNLIADRWRRRQRDERQAPGPPRSDSAEMRDLDVVRVFSQLKSRERALLWLAYVEGENHEGIADSLRVGRGSVKGLGRDCAVCCVRAELGREKTFKSQLLQRWDAQRKVQLPMDVMEPFEVLAGLAAAVLLLAWSMPSALQWIPRLTF